VLTAVLRTALFCECQLLPSQAIKNIFSLDRGLSTSSEILGRSTDDIEVLLLEKLPYWELRRMSNFQRINKERYYFAT